VHGADVVLLAIAGVVAGVAGSVAGLASLVSYPALLAVGLPALTANVTNTVALVFNGIGSVLGSRPELAGQGAWIRRIAPAAGGRRRGRRGIAVMHARRGFREGRPDPARAGIVGDPAAAQP
jgi:hypothetical protein